MNIVFVHCHYQRGGVTQVIQNQVRALRLQANIGEILLVGSSRVDGLQEDVLTATTSVTIEDFDYDEAAPIDRSEQMLAQLTQALAQSGLQPDSTVIHWHNHSLGKNTSAPAVIHSLAKNGWRQLLQIHDFAEDNRPTNYGNLIQACSARTKSDLDRYLYPVASQIHYATLTRADQMALRTIGVPPACLHWLPNSVTAPPGEPPSKQAALEKIRRAMSLPGDATWCLYPVRGIRRKNVGEFLLLSRWLEPNGYAGLTLRPTTPVEAKSYDRWRAIAEGVAPRAVFDAATYDAVQFADNMAASDFVLSTSVAEGFGMTFLEPWLSGRQVIARRLRTVTDDFAATGIDIPKLYDQIPIPGDSAWIRQCKNEYQTAINAAWQRVPTEFQPATARHNLESETMDFAALSPQRQVEVLRRMSHDPKYEDACQELSPTLVRNLRAGANHQSIDHNAKIISKQYSVQNVGQSLLPIYQQLLDAEIDGEPRSPANARSGIDTVNAVRPFYPCRTEVL